MAAKTQSERRALPAYTVREAAHYVGLSPSTVRYWAVGKDGSEPLFTPAATSPVQLSFFNLVETHVLAAIRRRHGVSMSSVRKAIDYLQKRLRSRRPLIDHEFETDGVDLFTEHLGRLINLTQDGQLAVRELLNHTLERIERDESGLPIKLYPFTRWETSTSPQVIVIDPLISAGRPVISGTGISTDIVAQRYKAGDSIRQLADDYGRSIDEIEEALRSEFHKAA